MKVKASFIKEELSVGLSAAVPLTYRGPEQKYALADELTSAHISYQKTQGTLELDITTADFWGEEPRRALCHVLVEQLPDSALDEAAEELSELRSHYLEIAAAESAALPPAALLPVAGLVDKEVTT
jgi:hypothetical protein